MDTAEYESMRPATRTRAWMRLHMTAATSRDDALRELTKIGVSPATFGRVVSTAPQIRRVWRGRRVLYRWVDDDS
jgi:hypothetical protein